MVSRPVSKRMRGFTLMEVIVGLAIIGILIIVFVVSQHETDTFERKNRIDLFTMPDKSLVIARIRHDIYDAAEIPSSLGEYRLTEETLILAEISRETKRKTYVVYDFQEPGKVKRLEFDQDGAPLQNWETNGAPKFNVKLMTLGDGFAFRLRAFEESGRMVIDQIMAPRVNNHA